MPVAERCDLIGTVIAITGASSGIGRSSAQALVAADAHVALAARRADSPRRARR
jgi:NADP-dependent 3-hydroxy acid dehydrogenase YdfG